MRRGNGYTTGKLAYNDGHLQLYTLAISTFMSGTRTDTYLHAYIAQYH